MINQDYTGAFLQEKNKMFHAIDTVPAVTKKARWALKWIDGWVVGRACISPDATPCRMAL